MERLPTPSATAQKAALVISPYRLLTDHILVESLCISKSNGLIDYQHKDPDKHTLREHYPQLPEQAKTSLTQFSADAIEKCTEEIKKQFRIKKAGMVFQSYFENAMLRKLHEQLHSLKPYLALLKWYHKTETEKGRYKTTPCSICGERPELTFEITRLEGKLRLSKKVTVNGNTAPLEAFNRHHFLLKRNNEYFLLSWKDYQTLQWLKNDEQLGNDSDPSLIMQIIARLDNDYKINRNGLLEREEINVLPHQRVMLSEISGSFIVFTPQWIYDGFTVEGPWKETFETNRNGKTYCIKRNKETEAEFVQLLESLHPNFSKQLNGYFYLSFSDAQKKQWFLKTYHKLLQLNVEIAGMDMLQHFRYSPHKISAQPVVKKEEANTVTLHMKFLFGPEGIPVDELQKIVRAGQRSVLLKDGSLGILHEEWLAQYGPILRHGKFLGDGNVQVPRWLAFSEQAEIDHQPVLKPLLKANWWQKWQQWQQENTRIFPMPATVNATLRPYQVKGFEWMVLLSEANAGACLADDMGLGKTLQTICFIAYRLQLSADKPHMIVCPSSLLYNWQQEFQKFAPSVSTLVYHGMNRNPRDLNTGKNLVIITSYGTVRSDIDEMNKAVFGSIVLDESHQIKNPDALTTRAIFQLNAETRIALSGTPVMNNTFDLYSQLSFLLPGMLGNRDFFNREYANPIDRERNEEKILALKKLTAPFILRRTKEQVATDLPPKTETVMWCKMRAEQKMLYDEVKSTIRDSLFLNIKNEGLGKAKLAVLHGMLKLRQLCNSPLLLPAEEQQTTESVKTEMLIYELSNELKAHKVLVFSQFASMLNLLAKALTDKGIEFYHFDGQTPATKRAEMVKSFQQEGNHTNVFLISLKAGNTGLNLTAADYVFLFDPWWNTAMQQQAIDRTHRIGQQKNVFAYKMICKDTIEEKIVHIQERKKQLSDDLVSEDEGFVKSLSEEDIRYLFS